MGDPGDTTACGAGSPDEDPRPTLVTYGAPLFFAAERAMPLETAVAHALQL